jgi:hypothetical protein
MKLMKRRRLIELAAGVGAGAFVGGVSPARAQTGAKAPAVGPLPARTDFIIRGDYVLSMDPVRRSPAQ